MGVKWQPGNGVSGVEGGRRGGDSGGLGERGANAAMPALMRFRRSSRAAAPNDNGSSAASESGSFSALSDFDSSVTRGRARVGLRDLRKGETGALTDVKEGCEGLCRRDERSDLLLSLILERWFVGLFARTNLKCEPFQVWRLLE